MTLPPELIPACDRGCGQRTARLHFSLPGEVSAIAPAVEVVSNLAQSHWGEDAEKLMEIRLALQEALANAVVHGCENDPGKNVECWVAADRTQGLLIVVRDPGPGFELAELDDPREPGNLQKSHGRGIHLICELMDEVHFQRHGTEIHMRKV